jgi:hypothetical protein
MFSTTVGPLTHSPKPWICRSCLHSYLQNLGPAAATRSRVRNHWSQSQRQHAGIIPPPSMEQIRAQYSKKNTTILYGGTDSGIVDCPDLPQLLCFEPDRRNGCPVVRLSAALQDGRIAFNDVLVHTLTFVSRYVSRWVGVANLSSRQVISLVTETRRNA